MTATIARLLGVPARGPLARAGDRVCERRTVCRVGFGQRDLRQLACEDVAQPAVLAHDLRAGADLPVDGDEDSWASSRSGSRASSRSAARRAPRRRRRRAAAWRRSPGRPRSGRPGVPARRRSTRGRVPRRGRRRTGRRPPRRRRRVVGADLEGATSSDRIASDRRPMSRCPPRGPPSMSMPGGHQRRAQLIESLAKRRRSRPRTTRATDRWRSPRASVAGGERQEREQGLRVTADQTHVPPIRRSDARSVRAASTSRTETERRRRGHSTPQPCRDVRPAPRGPDAGTSSVGPQTRRCIPPHPTGAAPAPSVAIIRHAVARRHGDGPGR